MAQRRTISLPDELDARLERLQDRINVSRVCAQALERELDMLEGTQVLDPDVSQAIARLKTAADLWFQRGYQDGRAWAVQRANRDELQAVSTWPEIPGFHAPIKGGPTREVVHERDELFKAHGRLKAWLQQEVEGERAEVDRGAYKEGWMSGAKVVAEAVLKSIRLGPASAGG